MRSNFSLIFIVALSSVAIYSCSLVDDVDKLWADFKTTYSKIYASDEEEANRKSIFTESMARSDKKNAINGAVSFGVTRFSDLTIEEFSILLGRKNKAVKPSKVTVRNPRDAAKKKTLKRVPLPRDTSTGSVAAVNWADYGVVMPVKNQGQCGSCWAFSAAEAVESEWAMNQNAPWEYSAQQIASCTPAMYGCGGGDTVAAYEYLMNTTLTPGLSNSWFAPYTQSMYTGCSANACTTACSSLNLPSMVTESALSGPYATISDYEFATTPCSSGRCQNQDTATLAANVGEYGPASVCVDASSWNDYTGGVLTQAACGGYSAFSIDHCVQLVGFNSTAPTPYWIVKNSWSTDWGINGFILLEYPLNSCGLANEATFVTLSNGNQ